jgi:alpha-L-rhamnosidase
VSAPTDLRAEHLVDPIGITVSRPRLSWRLPSGSRHQVAYQVQAGEWDSGRVESADSVLVDVAAPPLRSRERRTWRVRVWTDLGLSPWSAAAVVEAGLLDAWDWSARWIGPAEAQPAPPGHRPAHLLRREFSLPDDVVGARANITGHGVYELLVNGVRVGDAELTPGFTDYEATLQVQTYDVGPLLHPGANTIGVVLSDGWFRGINGMFRDFDCFGDRTAVLAQLHVELRGGNDFQVGTGPGWRSAVGSILEADLLSGMTVDLRREPTGWAEPAFDDSAWDEVTVAEAGPGILVSSPAPPVRRTEFRRPLSVSRAPSGAHVVDLGENIVGWVRLAELGPAGTETVLTYAEALAPDGEVSQRNLLPDHLPPGGLGELSAGQQDRVISAGRPGEVFEPRHATKGFRYVEIRCPNRDLTPDDVTGVVVHTDLRPIGSFRCSDPRLERLHEVAVRSFLGNAVDVPTDCPTRERSAWTGDWGAFVRPAAFLFDVAGFSDKWLRDLTSQQYPDGVVPNYVPDHLGARTREHPLLGSNLGSAGWGDAAVVVPWEVYLSSGDRGLLERQWPTMVAWVERAIRMARDHRHPARAAIRPVPLSHEEYLWDTGFHFGEWLEPGVQVGWEELHKADYSAVATAYLRLSTRLLARIADVLGLSDEAARYQHISHRVRQAWQTEFVTPTGTTTPDTQATLVRALTFDLVDDALRPVLSARLAELVRHAGTHLGTGFLATPELLPALADGGALDLAYEVLFQDSPPSWMHMLNQGATTVWELWEAIDDRGVAHESLNHYSKGAVIGFLHRYTAGLRTVDDGPGYRRFLVEPRPGGGLSWAEAVHDSPYGRIEVSWRITGETFKLRVVVPSGTSADVVLPDGQRSRIGPGTALFQVLGDRGAPPSASSQHSPGPDPRNVDE